MVVIMLCKISRGIYVCVFVVRCLPAVSQSVNLGALDDLQRVNKIRDTVYRSQEMN